MKLKNHGLSIVMFLLFIICLVAQSIAGWHAYNEEQQEHEEEPVGYTEYLRTGHFNEAVFENWESEFLQMAAYVALTAFLYQKGSAESKDPNKHEKVDADPRYSTKKDAPWPVKKKGIALYLYEHSLFIAFALLFLASFFLHGITGLSHYNEEQQEHGQEPVSLLEYMGSSQFWYESFQNWQSEFLAVFAIIVLSIFLRQRGSPESKPVSSPYDETGG